jgi:hypothetical protein
LGPANKSVPSQFGSLTLSSRQEKLLSPEDAKEQEKLAQFFLSTASLEVRKRLAGRPTSAKAKGQIELKVVCFE